MKKSRVRKTLQRHTARAMLMLLSATAFLNPAGSLAADANTGPCSNNVYADFDFWVGDWQVFKRESGKLAGIDMIEKTLGGCALRQEWVQLDDSFKPEGTDNRLRGESLLSVLPNGQWRQTWVDNSGYFNTLTGGLNDEGVMILESGPVQYPGQNGFANVYFKWHWEPLDDGTIRNWGMTKVGDNGEWEPSFDNIYKPNR